MEIQLEGFKWGGWGKTDRFFTENRDRELLVIYVKHEKYGNCMEDTFMNLFGA